MFALAHAHALWHVQTGFESLRQQEKSSIHKSGYRIFGGDGGIRTLDLTDANRTLSQLSYAPMIFLLFFLAACLL